MAQISAVDDVIAALLSVLGAALSVPVMDGLEVTSSSLEDFVIIGDDASLTNFTGRAATSTQTPSTYEPGSRNEAGSVTCAVISQSGDDDLAARRAASKVTMAAVEAALRATDNLGGVVATGYIASIDLFQARNAAGSMVRRVFTFAYTKFQD
jgi:hypothetical protein